MSQVWWIAWQNMKIVQLHGQGTLPLHTVAKRDSCAVQSSLNMNWMFLFSSGLEWSSSNFFFLYLWVLSQTKPATIWSWKNFPRSHQVNERPKFSATTLSIVPFIFFPRVEMKIPSSSNCLTSLNNGSSTASSPYPLTSSALQSISS